MKRFSLKARTLAVGTTMIRACLVALSAFMCGALEAAQACVAPSASSQCSPKAAAVGDSIWRILDRILAVEAASIKNPVYLISSTNIPFTITQPGKYVVCDDLQLTSTLDPSSIITVNVQTAGGVNGGPVILDLNSHFLLLQQNPSSPTSAINVESVDQLIIENGMVNINTLSGAQTSTAILVGNGARAVFIRDLYLGSTFDANNIPVASNTAGIHFANSFDAAVLNTRAFAFDSSFVLSDGSADIVFNQCDSAYAFSHDFFVDGTLNPPSRLTFIDCVGQRTRDNANTGDSFVFLAPDPTQAIFSVLCKDCVSMQAARSGFFLTNLGLSTFKNCSAIGSAVYNFFLTGDTQFSGVYFFDCLAAAAQLNGFLIDTSDLSNGFTLRSCIGFDNNVANTGNADFSLSGGGGPYEGLYNCLSNQTGTTAFTANILYVLSSGSLTSANYWNNMTA